MRIENQCGQLARTVRTVDRDVGVGVRLHVAQRGLRGSGVHVGGRQRQDGVHGGGERAPDAAIHSLLTGDPLACRLRSGELRNLRRRGRGTGGSCKRGHGGGAQNGRQAYGRSTHQGAADDVHCSRFPDLDPGSPTTRGLSEPQSLCLDGGNSSVLEVSRLMASPRRRTIHGCGPAPDFHRLPLTGSTAIATRLRAYGTTAGSPATLLAGMRHGKPSGNSRTEPPACPRASERAVLMCDRRAASPQSGWGVSNRVVEPRERDVHGHGQST